MTSHEQQFQAASLVLGLIMSRALASLVKDNKGAFEVLSTKIEEGFFERHQTKGALNALADALIGVTLGKAATDEDRKH